MAETPDFKHIAEKAIARWGLADELHSDSVEWIAREIAAELQDIWNARGAADLDAMETAHANYDWSELEDALRSLDR